MKRHDELVKDLVCDCGGDGSNSHLWNFLIVAYYIHNGLGLWWTMSYNLCPSYTIVTKHMVFGSQNYDKNLDSFLLD
jgi:hypothetical protein